MEKGRATFSEFTKGFYEHAYASKPTGRPCAAACLSQDQTTLPVHRAGNHRRHYQATAQVTNLGFAPVAGRQSLLYWPTSTTNYVLQTTASLSSPNWVTATHAVTVNAATVTNSAPAGFFRLLQSTNPPGMVLIPAGSFLIGNYLINSFYDSATNDPDITDAIPTNVYVSAFYMDVNLVSSNQWAGVYNYATGNGYTIVHAGVARRTTIRYRR